MNRNWTILFLIWILQHIEIFFFFPSKGAIKDSVVSEEIIADYLLYTLNKFEQYNYVKEFNLIEPTSNISRVLDAISKKIGAIQKEGEYNHLVASRYFLSLYRKGSLGKITLDDFDVNVKFEVANLKANKKLKLKREWMKCE